MKEASSCVASVLHWKFCFSLAYNSLFISQQANVSPLISYKTDASFAEKLVSILKTEVQSYAKFLLSLC